ncbi:hypothetical protein ACXA45_08990 [Neomicrococcus lactis]
MSDDDEKVTAERPVDTSAVDAEILDYDDARLRAALAEMEQLASEKAPDPTGELADILSGGTPVNFVAAFKKKGGPHISGGLAGILIASVGLTGVAAASSEFRDFLQDSTVHVATNIVTDMAHSPIVTALGDPQNPTSVLGSALDFVAPALTGHDHSTHRHAQVWVTDLIDESGVSQTVQKNSSAVFEGFTNLILGLDDADTSTNTNASQRGAWPAIGADNGEKSSPKIDAVTNNNRDKASEKPSAESEQGGQKAAPQEETQPGGKGALKNDGVGNGTAKDAAKDPAKDPTKEAAKQTDPETAVAKPGPSDSNHAAKGVQSTKGSETAKGAETLTGSQTARGSQPAKSAETVKASETAKGAETAKSSSGSKAPTAPEAVTVPKAPKPETPAPKKKSSATTDATSSADAASIAAATSETANAPVESSSTGAPAKK